MICAGALVSLKVEIPEPVAFSGVPDPVPILVIVVVDFVERTKSETRFPRFESSALQAPGNELPRRPVHVSAQRQ
jgi:hypothetical protein